MWHSVKEDQISGLKCLCVLSVSLTFCFSDNLCGLLFLLLSLHQIDNIIIIQSAIIVAERGTKQKRWWTWWSCRNSCRGGSRVGTIMSMSMPTENSCMSKSWLTNSWKLSGNKLLFMVPSVINSLRCTEHSQPNRILQVPLLFYHYFFSLCSNYEPCCLLYRQILMVSCFLPFWLLNQESFTHKVCTCSLSLIQFYKINLKSVF